MIRRIGGALLLLLVVIALLGFWQRERLQRLMAVNSLFAEDKIVHNFTTMGRMFLTSPIAVDISDPAPLPAGPDLALPDAVGPWIEQRSVTSLLVMQGGQVVSEQYFQGTGAEDLRISWSMAKSYLSALTGVLVAEGALPSIDVPVTDYAPELSNTAYDGATLRDVLQMSSGVVFDEDYLDFWSDINKMGRILALGGSMDGFAGGLSERDAEPGQAWRYVSIDTHVVGMVLRGATGRSISDLLAEKIVGPLRPEAAPYYLTDGFGVAFVLGGLNVTTRDYARFGQMFLQGGAWQGTQIVPADWVAASTVPSANTAPGQTGYGYQWWMPGDQPEVETAFFARGIYGQYIYIDPATEVVIVSTGADRQFRDAGVHDQNIGIFRQIAAAAAAPAP